MKFNMKLLVKLFVLGMCWALTYSLGYLQYLLYDPFREALACTNTELGLLLTVFGLGNIFGAPLGGWLADRFDYRKLFVISMIGNGLLSFVFAFHMTYAMALAIWVGLAVTGLIFNYPSHIKIVRMPADEENQGKIFGLNESFIGVGNLIANGLFLYIFARFVDANLGIHAVIIAIGVVSVVFGIAAWIILKDVKDTTVSESMKNDKDVMTFADFVAVCKSPATWIVGMGIFSIYSLMATMSYFTPYMTSVMGGTVTASGILAILRIHGVKLLGAPLGGYLTDKMRSVSKMLILLYILSATTLIAFIRLPDGISFSVFITLSFLVALFVYMGRGIYYAASSELMVPRKYAATTVGVAAALGFSPDLFIFAFAGHLLDTYGNDGYKYLFIFQVGLLLIGFFGSLYALRYKKRLLQNKELNAAQAV